MRLFIKITVAAISTFFILSLLGQGYLKYGDRFILPPSREYYQQVNSNPLSLDVEMLQ